MIDTTDFWWDGDEPKRQKEKEENITSARLKVRAELFHLQINNDIIANRTRNTAPTPKVKKSIKNR